jgi:hypothetical protein
MKPLISIVASAIRIYHWESFYNSLKNNIIPFEVIFVGNIKPLFDLPSNFTWIYSNECPAKCYQIGFDKAQGELINWTADDVEYNDGALDRAYSCYKVDDNPFKVVAFNCIENGSLTSQGHTIMGKESPLMSPIGLMNRELLISLGGYDKNFYCGQSENDLVMRVYEKGGHIEICKDAIVNIEHDKKHGKYSIFREGYGFPYHRRDRNYLESCWVKPDGSISQIRLKPFEPFIER